MTSWRVKPTISPYTIWHKNIGHYFVGKQTSMSQERGNWVWSIGFVWGPDPVVSQLKKLCTKFFAGLTYTKSTSGKKLGITADDDLGLCTQNESNTYKNLIAYSYNYMSVLTGNFYKCFYFKNFIEVPLTPTQTLPYKK